MIATHLRLGDAIEFFGSSACHHQAFEVAMLKSDMSISKLLRFTVIIGVRLDRHRFGDLYVLDYTSTISLVTIEVKGFAYCSLTPIVQALLVCRFWQVLDINTSDLVREFSLQSRLFRFESFSISVATRFFSETRHF